MGKQVNLFDPDAHAGAPEPELRHDLASEFVPRMPVAAFGAERLPEPRDEMCVIGRFGQVKTVRFLSVNEVHALVSWPISNDVIEVSLKTGDLKIKRGDKLWRLEPEALKACRRLRNTTRKKLRLLPEDE